MDRQPVESKTLKSVGFDPDQRVLEVEFQAGGVYQYRDVSENVYRDLLEAESKGTYFRERIRAQYPYVRIDQPGRAD